jgi:eukaryotic-like serine/threonine-protein kinase
VRRPSRRFPGEEEFAFRHALIREASYAMLTERNRALGHRLAARWLEQAGETDASVLAEHLSRGKEGARAARLFLRAAEEALRGGDVTAVIGRVERGLGALGAVRRLEAPNVNQGLVCGAEGELSGALIAVEAEAYGLVGDHARSRELAERALELTSQGSPSQGRALACAVVGALFSESGDASSRLLPRLLAFEPSPGAADRVIGALQGAVVALLVAGMREQAAAFLTRLEEVVAPIEQADPHAAATAGIARGNYCCYAEADPWAALAHDRLAASRFEDAGDRFSAPSATAYVGRDLMLLGAFEEAEEALSRALAADRRSESAMRPRSFAASLCGFLRAIIFLATGRLEEASAQGRETTAWAQARGDRVFETRGRLIVVEADILRGALDDAARELSAFGDLNTLAPMNRAAALSLLAEFKLAEGRPDEALRPAEEAHRIVCSSGVLVTFRDEACALVYAEALLASGDAEESRRVLEEAQASLVARASRITDPAYRRSFLEAVPVRARVASLAQATARR